MHFNLESPFWQFVNTLLRFTALNLLFVVTCIPLVTIGPARSALYGTVFAYDDHEDIPLCRQYLQRFIREFKQSIVAFIIHVALGAIIIYSLAFWLNMKGMVTYPALIILIIGTVLLVLSYEFFYPLQSRYTNTVWGFFKLSVGVPMGIPLYAICLLAIDVAFAFLIYSVPFLRVLVIIFGFSWLAYAKSLIYLRAFDRFERGTKGDTKTTYKNGSL